MKSINKGHKRTVFILFAVLFAVMAFTVSCGNTGYVAPSDIDSVRNVSYTEEEALILQKIAELGKYKAAQNTACDDAKALREELTSLGAFPSEEKLSEIKLEKSFSSNGEKISTLADFVRVFDGVYDVFGIEKSYESDGKTYTVYEAIVQEDGSDALTMKLVQNGRLGAEFFSESTAESVFYSEDNGKSTGSGAETVQGKTRSYSVIPFSAPTVSLIFVKSDDGEWYHTMTASYANINEIHYFVYTSIAYGKEEYKTGHEAYDSVKYPDSYEKRIAYAVEAYKLDKILCCDIVLGYDIKPKIAELTEIADKSFELEVASPINISELIKLAEN